MQLLQRTGLYVLPLYLGLQLLVDMLLANTAPEGHGHAYYAPDYIGPWVAVTDPENWTAKDTARLLAFCDAGYNKGCDTDRHSAAPTTSERP